jgi:hypothetical protein
MTTSELEWQHGMGQKKGVPMFFVSPSHDIVPFSKNTTAQNSHSLRRKQLNPENQLISVY